jgi:cell wall-associated NlpC family hydrolase
MYGCVDLIGMRYRLGGDGTAREIDCINMVYIALRDMQIETPPFDQSWYNASWRTIARDLLRWGRRVPSATYDGDVILLRQDRTAFAVTWSQGALYINEQNQQVAWCPLTALPPHVAFRCCRMSAS